MMRFFAAATFSILVALALAASLSAKGATTKITVRDSAISESIDITDGVLLAKFQVWAGPGVYHGRGPIDQGAGTIVEETEGFIIDWHAGIAVEHPSGLPQYQVSFYVTDNRFAETGPEELAYVVLYEPDSSTGEGYIYLPGPGDEEYLLNSEALSHGPTFEGHWLHASSAWQHVVIPLIARAARENVNPR
jgi:hypothetical protein